jgi:hypothetical protein
MDQSWMLVKSWAPFVVLMAIWLLIRRPLMRRLTARFSRARDDNKFKS